MKHPVYSRVKLIVSQPKKKNENGSLGLGCQIFRKNPGGMFHRSYIQNLNVLQFCSFILFLMFILKVQSILLCTQYLRLGRQQLSRRNKAIVKHIDNLYKQNSGLTCRTAWYGREDKPKQYPLFEVTTSKDTINIITIQ